MTSKLFFSIHCHSSSILITSVIHSLETWILYLCSYVFLKNSGIIICVLYIEQLCVFLYCKFFKENAPDTWAFKSYSRLSKKRARLVCFNHVIESDYKSKTFQPICYIDYLGNTMSYAVLINVNQMSVDQLTWL